MTVEQKKSGLRTAPVSDQPLVSFVLIAYNQEKFIREAINGALSQTYEPMELVLSDDCSSDRTFEIMKEMAAAYTGPHRIVLNRNAKNLGIGTHFQQAVALSGGRWIVAAAGDDISIPERVAKCMEIVMTHGELGCISGRFHGFSGQFKDEKKRAQIQDVVKVIRGTDTSWLGYSRRGKIPGMPGCSAMWNRKLFELFSSIPLGVVAEDVVLRCRALISGLGVGFTSAGLVYYRAHDENCSSGVQKELYERRVFFSKAVAYRDLLEYRKNHPNLYSDEIWERMIRYFETYLFRSIVIVRRNEVGRFWSQILYLIGFRGARRSKA